MYFYSCCYVGSIETFVQFQWHPVHTIFEQLTKDFTQVARELMWGAVAAQEQKIS